MKSRTRNLSKSELSLVRHNMGLTIKEMARAVGLKLPSYYYYETRFAGEALPDWLSQKVFALARKRKVALSPRALRSLRDAPAAKPSADQIKLLHHILKTLNDIKTIVRARGPSAVFVVQDGQRPSGRGPSNAPGRVH